MKMLFATRARHVIKTTYVFGELCSPQTIDFFIWWLEFATVVYLAVIPYVMHS